MWPAIVTVPLRCGPLFAMAVTVTTPVPDDDASDAESHAPLILVAHPHAVDGVDTVMTIAPPAAAMTVLDGTTV